METKSFAFRLADRKPRDPGKWQARDGVAPAGCSQSSMLYWRQPYPGGQTHNGSFC